MYYKKNNNRGLSLVELLVALAISSLIVVAAITLISQGMKSAQKQTLAAQLQEDAGIAMNQISDAIMETVDVDISNYDSDANHNTLFLKLKRRNKDGTEITYEYHFYDTEKALKVKITSSPSGAESVLCNNVTQFRVQIVRSSVDTENKTLGVDNGDWITRINNPVQVKVTMEVSSGSITRGISRVTGLRNSLGIENLTLQSFRIDKLPDKEVLNKCQFLTD